MLMKRNAYIAKHIKDFELVIFHERMPGWHRDFIQSGIKTTIQWVDVAQLFQNDVPSYNCMCHFHSIDCWEYLSRFDIALRVDDDIYIRDDIDYTISNNAIVFHKQEKDCHRTTFETFPAFFEKYALYNYGKRVHGHAPRMHFCSHFCMYNVSWWMQDDVQKYLKACSEGIKKYRWGDHVVQSGAIQLFDGVTKKLYTKYHHLSPQ
jgi:hypothetical protein